MVWEGMRNSFARGRCFPSMDSSGMRSPMQTLYSLLILSHFLHHERYSNHLIYSRGYNDMLVDIHVLYLYPAMRSCEGCLGTRGRRQVYQYLWSIHWSGGAECPDRCDHPRSSSTAAIETSYSEIPESSTYRCVCARILGRCLGQHYE